MINIKELSKYVLYQLKLLNFLTKFKYNTYKLLKEGYNPKHFWEGWSDGYSIQKVQQRIGQSQFHLLSKLEELKPRSVLEIGCGFGKNLKFIIENISYPIILVGFDISKSMVLKAKNNLNERVLLGCGDINALPFHDLSYDLVFTHGTLMHVPEDNINQAIKELKRITKNYLIIIEETYWSIGKKKQKTILKPNDYTFIYDYEILLKKNGLHIREKIIIKERLNLIFLLCKTNN